MSGRGPEWAAEYPERQAEEAYCRERDLNEFVRRKNPNLEPTARYAAGPLPSSHPRLSSRADHFDYLRRREFGRWNKGYTMY